jgi:DNA-binding response OmpR family regulator
MIHRTTPMVVVVRHRLDDGFSDDVIASLAGLDLLPTTKVIVLFDAGTSSSKEVRQIVLGADCVQRDPVRTDVLTAFLAKYIRTARALDAASHRAPIKTAQFCGAVLCAVERTLSHRGHTVLLTPREVALVEQLAHSRENVVTYERLYGEILGRKFRGDTSNLRVLFGKLCASTQTIGIALRHWVDVIPKTGYRYHRAGAVAPSDDTIRCS